MQANLSASQILARLEGLEPSIIDPKKLKPIVASSSYCIIFYHKISYQKSLNPFIYRHFNYLTLSNNTIQYKHEKIQHKTTHLQKSCIFPAKICSSNTKSLNVCYNNNMEINNDYFRYKHDV